MANDFLVYAFDPGITTGYAAAYVDTSKYSISIFDVKPILFTKPSERIRVGTPPVELFSAFCDEITKRIDDTAIQGVEIYSAVENFIGGTGGDIQNTVNKLIGSIIAVFSSGNKLFAYGNFNPIKIYKNTSRNPYRTLVDHMPDGHLINEHSRDALMHLFHRVEGVVGEEFPKYTVFLNTTTY